jgi:hypothetical protein
MCTEYNNARQWLNTKSYIAQCKHVSCNAKRNLTLKTTGFILIKVQIVGALRYFQTRR